MKTNDIKILKSLHAWIRLCSPYEITFISILTFPIILTLYETLFKFCGFAEYEFKFRIYIGIFLFYIIAIIIMKIAKSYEEKYERDINELISEFICCKKEFLSFEHFRNKNNGLKNKRLEKLLKYAPSIIRKSRIKENKEAIQLIDFRRYMDDIFKEDVELIISHLKQAPRGRMCLKSLSDIDKSFTINYLKHLCKYAPNEISILNENGEKYLAYNLLGI